MVVVRELKRCTHSRKARALGIGEEIAVLLKRCQLDPERGACVHVHDVVVTRRRWICRCPIVGVLVLAKHHRVTWKETQFLGWTISSGAASLWPADRSQPDVLCRIDGEQLLNDLPDFVLD